MGTKPKIKIKDCTQIRREIDNEYENTNQVALAKWAIVCAKHISQFLDEENLDFKEIEEGFKVNELWQYGKAAVHEVGRLALLYMGSLDNVTELAKNAVRAAGQAVAVGHMREHAMVCSDYVIKTIGLAFSDDLNRIREERMWQLNEIRKLKNRA
ncbi:putative immunity protein [Pedobacter sp. MR22-3]|uniref:putative immunity protein n=1 Tax=Pedobacter sp. MR22-3 TaxID=2994552 RepID=UPI002245EFAE|nr:hypothetical protein [Pedobacter sp. MR22-3]MCX2584400.1 hypothetical protein [Pedobacter sp. MR22-3]